MHCLTNVRLVLFCIVITSPPFKIQEEGWGEFDMQIVLTAMEKGGDTTLSHDLNFAENRYETKHVVVRYETKREPQVSSDRFGIPGI